VCIVPVWVVKWPVALPYACYGQRRGDLTPVISGLSGWADARTWVTSQGGLEHANGGAVSGAGLGRGGDG
jgi:hypothetical protein